MAWIWGMSENKEKGAGERERERAYYFYFPFALCLQVLYSKKDTRVRHSASWGEADWDRDNPFATLFSVAWSSPFTEFSTIMCFIS